MVSINCKTNGLWGYPFLITIAVSGEKPATFKCPINGPIDPWVKQNMLPQITEVSDTHSSYEEMMKAVGEKWTTVCHHRMLVHMGFIVESYMFRELVRLEYIHMWDAPYIYTELAQLLESHGHQPDTAGGYIYTHGLTKPDVPGGAHNSEYGAVAALTVYEHLTK